MLLAANGHDNRRLRQPASRLSKCVALFGATGFVAIAIACQGTKDTPSVEGANSAGTNSVGPGGDSSGTGGSSGASHGSTGGGSPVNTSSISPSVGGAGGAGGASSSGGATTCGNTEVWRAMSVSGIEWPDASNTNPSARPPTVASGWHSGLVCVLRLPLELLTFDPCANVWNTVPLAFTTADVEGAIGSVVGVNWAFDHFVLTAIAAGTTSQKIAELYPGDSNFRTALTTSYEAPTPTWTFTGLAAGRYASTANSPRYKLAWGGAYTNDATKMGPNDPPAFPAGDGKVYSYAAGTWSNTSPRLAPSARYLPKIALLGGKFFVWGGFADGTWPLVDPSSALSDGALYDPVADSWSAVSALGAPTQSELSGVYLPPTMQALSNGQEVFVIEPSGGAGGVWSSATNSWALITGTTIPSNVEFFVMDSGALAAIGATDTWVVSQSGGNWRKYTQGRFQDALPTGALIADSSNYSVEVWTGSDLVRFGPYSSRSYGCDGPRPPNTGCDPMIMLTVNKFGTLLSTRAM